MNYLLLLLPVLTQARIMIDMIASNSEEEAKVDYNGYEEHIITDKDRDTFRLSNDTLKAAVTEFFGERPTHVYLKSKTPWGDLYTRFHWNEVKVYTLPIGAQIIEIHTEPTIISTQEFQNDDSVEATFTATISQSIEDTVSNTWSMGGELGFSQEISYGVQIVGVSGSSSLSFSSNWGEETSKSKTTIVGSSTSVEIKLQPGKVTQAILSANKGTMVVQVDYVSKLKGSVACNYADTYKDHHFWKHDINNLLSAIGLPKKVFSREIVKIGFYSNVHVKVKSVLK